MYFIFSYKTEIVLHCKCNEKVCMKNMYGSRTKYNQKKLHMFSIWSGDMINLSSLIICIGSIRTLMTSLCHYMVNIDNWGLHKYRCLYVFVYSYCATQSIYKDSCFLKGYVTLSLPLTVQANRNI